MGSQTSQEQMEKIQSYITYAEQSNAEILTGVNVLLTMV